MPSLVAAAASPRSSARAKSLLGLGQAILIGEDDSEFERVVAVTALVGGG